MRCTGIQEILTFGQPDHGWVSCSFIHDQAEDDETLPGPRDSMTIRFPRNTVDVGTRIRIGEVTES